MSDQTATHDPSAADTPEQIHAALFAHLVMQQSNMALMLLGRTPHPETGETIQDLEAAKLFIDMIEMLEAKTKGNLTKEESGLLKQSLMTLRLAYVQAVEAGPATGKEASKPEPTPGSAPAQPAEAPKDSSTPSEEEEHRKKFSKKY